MSSVQVLAGFSLRGSGSGVGMEKKKIEMMIHIIW